MLFIGSSTVKGAVFDGADYLTRNSSLADTSAAASMLGSFWIKPNLSDASQRVVIAKNQGAGGAGLFVEFGAGTSTLQIGAIDVAGSTSVFTFTGPTLSNNVWHHVLFAYDSATLTGKLYVDATFHSNPTTNLGGLIGIPTSTQIASFVASSTANFTGSLAEVWIGYGQYLDLTSSPNRAKFITVGNKPASLGATGTTPTGVRPTLFFKGDGTAFGTNRGVGGAFTQTGTLGTATGITL